MEAQIPAIGVLEQRGYGDVKRYRVACDCGCGDADHDLWIEADEAGVSVEISTTQKTDYWTESIQKRYDIDNEALQEVDWFWKGLWNGLCTRLRLTRDIWVHGYVKYEAAIIMNKQQAFNYSEALKNAVGDVEAFRKNKDVWN